MKRGIRRYDALLALRLCKKQFKDNNMKRVLSALALGVAVGVLADSPRELGWTDLTVKVEFEDPFEKLDQGQLYDLSIYARIQRMIKSGLDVTDGMKAEMAESEKKLRDGGVDIEGLLAKRDEIAALRKKRAMAMDETLDGKTIRMPGYALALEYDGKKVKEFLLVPWVGACIHTPPPPPNQIVYVKASDAFDTASRYEPVWIEGVMKVGADTKELYLVDGSADINIGYSMTSATIEKYSEAPRPVIKPARHEPTGEGV
jgi:hypothetical protein